MVCEHMVSRMEVCIPSMKNLVSDNASKRRGGEVWPDAHGPFQVSYRIGPEAFSRTFLPNDQCHLSSALPGGDGDPATVLAAVEALVADEGATADPTLGLAEQALVCQRILTAALSPLVQRAMEDGTPPSWRSTNMEATVRPDWHQKGSVPPWHLWPKDGDKNQGSFGRGELDAEGLLRGLREYWPKVVDAAPAHVELLEPLEALVALWGEQAQLTDACIIAAVRAGAELLRALDFAAHALELDALCPPTVPSSSQDDQRRKHRTRRMTVH